MVMDYMMDASSMAGSDAALGLLAGFGVAGTLVSLVVCVLLIASLWMVFAKAGVAGWKCLIPIYNMYTLYKIAWGNGWLFLLTFIPFVNFVVAIICMHKLSKAFGHGVGFTLGLVCLPYVFYPVLAFGKSQYIGIQ
jgi:hypothetical protein